MRDEGKHWATVTPAVILPLVLETTALSLVKWWALSLISRLPLRVEVKGQRE